MDKKQKARVAALEADRKAAGLSYRALGQAAGVSDSRIREAVKDVGNMNDDNWGKTAAAMPGGKLAVLLEKEGIAIPAPLAATAPAHAVRHDGEAAAGIVAIPFGRLRPNPDNYRKSFDPEDIAALAESIAERGVLQNLVVREADRKGVHTINSGGRRYAALMSLREQNRIDDSFRVNCLVLRLKDAEARALALIENLQRQDVPVLEEAEGFKALTALGWDTEKIATACRIAQRTVQDRLQLIERLAPLPREALAGGKITLEQARAIMSTPNEADQNDLLTDAVQSEFTATELREAAKRNKPEIGKAAFDLAQYKGEFIGSGTSRVFADVKAFMKLQHKAAAQRVKELEESGELVAVTLLPAGKQFEWGGWQRTETGKNEHAFVYIGKWSWKIEVTRGVCPRPEALAGDDDEEEERDPAQIELEQEIARKREEAETEATRQWLRDMLAAVPSNPGDYFRREILLGLTGKSAQWRPEHLDTFLPENLPATLRILREATGHPFIMDEMPDDVPLEEVPLAEHLGIIGEFDAAFLDDWLDRQDDWSVIQLYVQLEASRCTLHRLNTLAGSDIALSEKLGVPVPPHLIPEPDEDDDIEDEEEAA
ncbi:MAG: ParB/RepB/Spo0J family partition protein [Parvibaculum sp.]|uniref:ParB/RepB/Spo0J family partition protein n=1 Tax=Parvibaculum sp. TaxID=2024848 RepID=UPI0027313FAD|nr:ParB/RepB/Spo0J family partition protein [Parvibaculum sp.]MDP1628822.1 ParB/RepB/Spo0J family partition protein [Parvibaculum sp.]MDP2148217.1 ParB/RepB/Spo0J family partition protein [Parvibaculum sp.]